jgi:uncharacterized protein
MKYLLLILIKIYWYIIPESNRRRCLFKTSCSNYVYKITENKGIINGLKALRFRSRNCNANYTIIKIGNKRVLVSSTNKVFDETMVNNLILNQNSQ